MRRSALKTATSVLIDDVGGLVAAASTTRVGTSVLAEYYSRNHESRFMPIDIVADIEARASVPFVTAALAHAAGCELVKLPHGCQGDVAARLMVLGQRFAALFSEVSRALADGKIDAGERERMEVGLCDVRAAAADALAALRQDAGNG